MKINKKNNSYVFFAYIVFLVFFFLILRLPSLIEPYWYGDEGIYAGVASQILQGKKLYVDVWDHKPPGIFIIYTIIGHFSRLFSIDYQFLFRLVNLFFGGITLLIGVWISKLLHNKFITGLVGIFLLFLIGTPYLEANVFNAENIFILFTALAYFIFYKNTYKNKNFSPKIAFFIGLLFGLAIFVKIQPLFEMAGLILLAIVIGIKNKINLSKIFRYVFFIFFVSMLPIIISFIYYLVQGNVDQFIFSNFTFNLFYASGSRLQGSLSLFTKFFILVFITLGGIFLFFLKRIDHKFLFVFIWVVFAVLGSSLSSRTYAHYLLQLVVPITMFIWTFILYLILNINNLKKLDNISSLILFIMIVSVIIKFFPIGQYKFGYIESKKNYYLYGYSSLINNDKNKFNSLFGHSVLETKEISKIIDEYGKNIWVWEDGSWYIWKNNIDWPTKYLVNFHINDSNSEEVISDIKKNEVSIIIVEKERPLLEDIANMINHDYNYLETRGKYEIYKYFNGR